MTAADGSFESVDSPMIFRSNSVRVFITIYFCSIILLLFAVILTNPSAFQYPLVIIVFCIVGMYRAIGSGYMAVYPERIVVRTLVTTRTFEIKNVKSIEIRTYLQFTTRVRPVLIFRDGSVYNLSEFFMRKRLFEMEPEKNKVAQAVEGVGKWLDQIR